MAKAIRIISLAAVLLLALLALPVPTAHVAEAGVSPSDVWVAPPPVGNDSNPGTEVQPFATIQKGIDTVELGIGGTVHVAAGTYHENLLISGAVNLTGAGAQNTIINGGGSGRVIGFRSTPNSENVISGFTIQNGRYAASLWNPTDERVMYAGLNLHFLKMLPQPSAIMLGGGGILISETHIVTLNDCVIKDNISQRGGGITNTGQLHMYSCIVSGNTATTGEGGGIFNTPGGIGNSGKMWLTNCTISSNSASSGGGGIYNDMWAEMNLSYVTIANNQATGTSARGGGFENVGPANFEDTIVANNTAGEAAYNNGYNITAQGGVTTSMGYNLCGDNSCGFDQPTDLVGVDPVLGALQDNGGPTFTHALLHGSPAIDAGNNTGAPATDQRGVPRPQGTTCDIGAYELAQASVITATGTGTASFSTLNGYITGLTALNESALTCPPIESLDFTHGLFSFKVTDITPGSSATVVIILPLDVPIGTQYWKCINGQWVDCTSLLGSNDGDSVLTLTITDGGLGDLDGVVNGEISDPGGPAVAPVTGVATATGSGTAIFSTSAGGIADLTALATTSCGMAPTSFPHGFFSFNIVGITAGSTVTITITFPSDMPTSTQYWKCLNGQWVDCTSLLGSNDGDSVLTLTITDGGLGDLDGVVNGEISDPGGPAVVAAPAGPGASPTPPRPLNPSQMSLQYLSINPQQTGANQPITITTNVVNTGDEAGNINVTLKINGQVEESRMVSVGPHGTQPVKFTVTRAQPGTYNVDILGKSGNFIILGASNSTSSSSGNSGLIVLLIIGMLVLATAVVLVLSRRPA